MIQPTDTPIIVAVPPTAPIDTLAELRSQHSALLQRQSAGQGTLKPTLGEILGFLKAASMLGRTLEDIEQRETAQAIMDYWIATLLSEAPQLSEAEDSRPFSLLPFDEGADSLVADDAHKSRMQAAAAGEKADHLFSAVIDSTQLASKSPFLRIFDLVPDSLKPSALKPGTSEGEGGLLTRLLLRFLRLKENSAEVYSVPLPADDDILREPAAKGLFAKLVEANVVRMQDPENPDNKAFVLIHDSLITTWGFLREIAWQRRAFRQVARGWDNGGRNSEALLRGGHQLEQAQDYQDLNPTERAFLDASRRETDRARRLTIGVISSLLVIAVIAAVFLWTKNKDLEKKKERLTAENTALETTKIILEKENKRLTGTQEDMKKENTALETTKIILEDENKDLTTTQAELERQKKALEESIKQLGERNEGLEKETKKMGQRTTDLQQSLAIEQTSQSRFGSLNDLLNYPPSSLPLPDLTKVVKRIVADATKDKKPKRIPNDVIMFEVFVSTATPRAWTDVMPYVKALEGIGFVIPAGGPLPRKNVAAISVVRYFHKEDEQHADRACRVLLKSGFPDKRIKSKREYDATAPRGFLQISVAKDAFKSP